MLMAVEMWVKRDHDAEWKRVDRLARSHRRARVDDTGRDDVGRAAERPVEQHAVAAGRVGSTEGSA